MEDAVEAVCESDCLKFKIKKELKSVGKCYFVGKKQQFMNKLYVIKKKILL